MDTAIRRPTSSSPEPSPTHSSAFSNSSEISLFFFTKSADGDTTEKPSRWQQFQQWKLAHSFIGWRFSLKIGAMSAATIFFINAIVIIWALAANEIGSDGRTIFYEGDCTAARSHSRVVHFYINISSTLLLVSSNFSMQCLSAPDRSDIDRAHARKKWLDIGVPSIRNIVHMRRNKTILWFALALTSLLVHLLFNSTIFSTIAANSYTVYTVGPGVLQEVDKTVRINKTIMPSSVVPFSTDIIIVNPITAEVNGTESEYFDTRLRRYRDSECIGLFGQEFISSRRFVFLELAPGDYNGTASAFKSIHHVDAAESLESDCATDSYAWMCAGNEDPDCGQRCDFDNLTQSREFKSGNWTPSFTDIPIQGCYTQEYDEYCKLEMSSQLAISVIAVTAVKVLVISIMAVSIHSTPLLTVGDAISSFIDEPDLNTRNMPFLQLGDAAHHWAWTSSPRFWLPLRQSKYCATTRNRRVVFAIIYSTILGLTLSGLILGLKHVKGPLNLESFIQLGFGTVNVQTIIGADKLPYTWQNALLANLAQPLISTLCFSYNGMLTAMAMGTEWDAYGRTRKGLRVSTIPCGSQRGSHFLQLPFRFGVPLAIMSSLVHWSASQSLFAVSVDLDNKGSIVTCGYSPVAASCLLIALLAMLIYFAFIAHSKFRNGTPVAGSCSAAIAAACHPLLPPPKDEQGAKLSELPLQWGVGAEEGSESHNSIHCAFSPLEVVFPERSMDFDCWKQVTKKALAEKGLLHGLPRDSFLSMLPMLRYPTNPRFGKTSNLNRWLLDGFGKGSVEARREVRARTMYSAWGPTASEFWDGVDSLCNESERGSEAQDLVGWLSYVWEDENQRWSDGNV